MGVNRKIDEALKKLTFENREADFHHHSHDEDMLQYELIKAGDMRSVEVGKRMFEGPTTGSLSDDPVKNYQYLFVASITLASRFCIEGGMSTEEAYNLSDLYIRQVDRCRVVEEIFALHDTMFADYTSRMKALGRGQVYARPVHQCMDYIDQHLMRPLTLRLLAEELGLSESYLSMLFKKETGVTLSDYIRRKRVETAKTLLEYTQFSCMEIAEYLCFSSDSHFTRIFKEYTGETPREYRKRHTRGHWE